MAAVLLWHHSQKVNQFVHTLFIEAENTIFKFIISKYLQWDHFFVAPAELIHYFVLFILAAKTENVRESYLVVFKHLVYFLFHFLSKFGAVAEHSSKHLYNMLLL